MAFSLGAKIAMMSNQIILQITVDLRLDTVTQQKVVREGITSTINGYNLVTTSFIKRRMSSSLDVRTIFNSLIKVGLVLFRDPFAA